MKRLVIPAVLLMARAAVALPAPKTEDELLQMSDLVVDAECMSIVCDGVPVEDAQKITTTYLSTLWPSKSYKGGMPNSFQIRGKEEQWKTTPPTGGWHQGAVPKGWVGKLYLKQEIDGTYTKVWWNAMEEDTTLSSPQTLPTCAVGDGGPPDGAMPDLGPAPDGTVTDGQVVADQLTGDQSAASDTSSTDTGSSADGTAPPSDDGCSCGVGRGSPAGGILTLLLLALVLVRRSRS